MLKEVEYKDSAFLYYLLELRLAEKDINISHEEMPTREAHDNFVKLYKMNLGEYIGWYIIMDEGHKVGVTYLSNRNEIGIYLIKECREKGLGRVAVRELMELFPEVDFYLANISPKNGGSMRFFDRLGFKKVQETFKLERDKK